jgi:chemotaxis response regulator CheB
LFSISRQFFLEIAASSKDFIDAGKSGDRSMAMGSPQAKPKRSHKSKKPNGLIVVGIGASAGGLEALKLMLPGLPVNGSMAYIIIQHLDPHRRSMMTALLEPHTKMKVVALPMRLGPTPISPNRLLTRSYAKSSAH